MSDTAVVGRARRDDPTTSWAAASEHTAAALSKTAAALLELVKKDGPATDEKLWAEWEWARYHRPNDYPRVTQQRLRTVRSELVRAGKVADSGQRGQSPTGRPAVMWQVAA